jgi:hypothetical protein
MCTLGERFGELWRFRAEELDGAMMAAPSAAKNGESFNATGK